MSLDRLALAAALLEYDNDNPASGLGYRHAGESAILRGATEVPVSPPAVGGRERKRHSQVVVEDRGSRYGFVPGKGVSDDGRVEELDMAEVDLTSWGLPETMLRRESPEHDAAAPSNSRPPLVGTASYTYKPAVASAEGRKHRKGRTVSFHGFTSFQDEDVEELQQQQQQQEEVDKGERPKSSMSVMNRGRPTSPFNAPLASPVSTTFSPIGTMPQPQHVPLPLSPGPLGRPASYVPVMDEGGTAAADDDRERNPFALPAPAGPRLSRFDPKYTAPVVDARHSQSTVRPTSIASGYFPPSSGPPPAAPVSRLHPRTLIMPTPLHGVLDPTQNQPSREGFTHGAKPLPPGALTRPDSFVGRMDGKGFTSSQQLFRVSLAATGRDGGGSRYGYEGVDLPPSAERDGEVGVRQYGGRMEDDDEVDEEDDEVGQDDWRPETRFVRGPSLMDRLEARKAELKSKNRQFKGDNRPAMMSRQGPLVDLDASVDPTTGQTSPRAAAALQLQDDSGRPLVRSSASPPQGKPGLPRGKSVFGVDTVWERELKKLEAKKEEERAQAEKRGKKGKRGKRDEVHPHTEVLHEQGREDTNVPPSLSLGDLAAALNAPEVAESVPHQKVSVDDWAAGSDEEQAVPRRRKRRTVKPPVMDSDSDGDNMPLAAAFGIRRKEVADDSSEDEPLSNLKKKVSSRTLDAGDEDDIPLALRRAKKMAPPIANEQVDEDDLPLAQRRLRAQQTGVTDPGVQQQQQMAIAMAQQHQSMMFNPMSMYGMPMMGMPGMPMGMPPPMGWNGFGDASTAPSLDPKIDRWRREVEAREGSISVPPSVITSGGRS